MVFPTVSYSTKINTKFESSKKFRLSHPKVGPRHAPNRHNRIAAYDKAFQRYIQMDSKLAIWKERMDQKGLPGPLVDGYQRSSSSWQHSLSSISSESSTCTHNSFTSHRAKNGHDVKPTKSITITTASPPAQPMPKPSVSRRIINRLSLSRSNSKNHHSSKVAPTATQSLRRHSSGTPSPYQQKYDGPSIVIHPLPTPSYSILQQQKQNPSLRISLDRHLHQNSNAVTRSHCHYASPSPRLSVPASCGIEDYLSQKRYPRSSAIAGQPLASTRVRSTIIH